MNEQLVQYMLSHLSEIIHVTKKLIQLMIGLQINIFLKTSDITGRFEIKAQSI